MKIIITNTPIPDEGKVISKSYLLRDQKIMFDRDLAVISNKEKMGLRKLPDVFTEEGVAMLSGVLNSGIAIEVNIRIMRVFTKLRESLLANQDI